MCSCEGLLIFQAESAAHCLSTDLRKPGRATTPKGARLRRWCIGEHSVMTLTRWHATFHSGSEAHRAIAMSNKPSRRCIFCGIRAANSKEHFWSSWMTKTIQFPRTASHRIAHRVEHPPTGMVHRDVRQTNGSLNSRKIRAVCTMCNNGWMNRLEAEARRLLEPMMLG